MTQPCHGETAKDMARLSVQQSTAEMARVEIFFDSGRFTLVIRVRQTDEPRMCVKGNSSAAEM